LLKPALNPPPFVRPDDPRQDVEGENFLHAGPFTVNVEGDALLQQFAFGGLLTLQDQRFRQGPDGRQQAGRRRARPAFRTKHLIIKTARLIILKGNFFMYGRGTGGGKFESHHRPGDQSAIAVPMR